MNILNVLIQDIAPARSDLRQSDEFCCACHDANLCANRLRSSSNWSYME